MTTARTKNASLSFIKFFACATFLATSGLHACINFDFDNQTDKPAIIKDFSRHYSLMCLTTDMEIDSHEEFNLEIGILYQDLFKYWDSLKKNGVSGFGEKEEDFIKLTIGEDEFVLHWNQDLGVSVTKNHEVIYDAKIEPVVNANDSPLEKRYKLTLIAK